jgi:hypothetical protein
MQFVKPLEARACHCGGVWSVATEILGLTLSQNHSQSTLKTAPPCPWPDLVAHFLMRQTTAQGQATVCLRGDSRSLSALSRIQEKIFEWGIRVKVDVPAQNSPRLLPKYNERGGGEKNHEA